MLKAYHANNCLWVTPDIEAQEALLREAVEALHQYVNDMRYPPERDSRERRIAMAQTTLAKLREHLEESK